MKITPSQQNNAFSGGTIVKKNGEQKEMQMLFWSEINRMFMFALKQTGENGMSVVESLFYSLFCKIWNGKRKLACVVSENAKYMSISANDC